MAEIQNLSEIQPTLGFTEFDILEKYCKNFNESELDRLHWLLPFERMAKAASLSEQHWSAGISSALRQRLPFWS